MRHAPEYIAVMRQLLPLFRRHKSLCTMSFEELCDHCAYFWNRGTLCYILSDYSLPRAVCLIKLFRRIEQFLDLYVHEPCGEFCMIEVMVADDPLAMGKVFEQFKERWGPHRVILWDREERTEVGAPRMYTWHRFEKLARRLSYGVIASKWIYLPERKQ